MFGPGYTGSQDCPRLGNTSDIPEPEQPVKYYVSEEFENNWMLVAYGNGVNTYEKMKIDIHPEKDDLFCIFLNF